MAAHSSTLAWKIHGQRSLVGYSPWGRKELDMTERLHLTYVLIKLESYHVITCFFTINMIILAFSRSINTP